MMRSSKIKKTFTETAAFQSIWHMQDTGVKVVYLKSDDIVEDQEDVHRHHFQHPPHECHQLREWCVRDKEIYSVCV